MKKTILIIICSLFLISFTSALTYEQNKELDLKIPFEVNGSNPSSSATCNVSIKYPNESYVRENQPMSYQSNGEFNITLNNNETATLGNFNWIASCCDGTSCAMGYDIFEVTRTGKVTPDSLPTLYGVMMIIIFGVSCVFLFLSVKITEAGPKIFLMLASLIFLIGSVGLGVVFADENNVGIGVSNLMGNMLFAMGMIFIVIFFYIFIRQIVETLNLLRVKQGLSVGEYKTKGAY